MYFLSNNGDIPASYVSLPEGNCQFLLKFLTWNPKANQFWRWMDGIIQLIANPVKNAWLSGTRYIIPRTPNGAPCFGGLTFKNRGQLGSRHIYEYIIIYIYISNTFTANVWTRFFQGFMIKQLTPRSNFDSETSRSYQIQVSKQLSVQCSSWYGSPVSGKSWCSSLSLVLLKFVKNMLFFPQSKKS